MMNRPLFKRIFPRALAWAALAALCGAIALGQDQAAAGGQRTDGQIEMDVVHALDASNALKNDMITAATIQGEVTLSGTVSNAAAGELAESIASHVQGVTKVNNNLKVGNPQDAQAAASAGDASAQQVADDAQADAAPAPAPQDAQPMPQPNAAPAPSQPGPPPPPPARPQYAPGYPPAYPQYAPPPQYAQAPPPPAYEAPKGPVTIPQGTLIQLRTAEPVDGKHAKDGTAVQFTVIRDIAVGGVLAIPRGATVHGVVTEDKKAGTLGGSPVLALKLTSLDLGGQSYPIDTDEFKVKGPNKAGETAGNAFGGAVLGAIIGGIADRGVGAGIGAAAGAGAGVAASAATPGPRVWIPAEALVDFHLNTPLTVTPVSQQEAARLAQGLYPGGPTLYRRGGYYGYPYGYPYPPPVYYRPYYMAGGYYYWR
jgi:hypothetical protein